MFVRDVYFLSFLWETFLLQIYTTEYGYKVASNVLLQLFLHFDDGIFPVGNVIQGTELSGLASDFFLLILKDCAPYQELALQLGMIFGCKSTIVFWPIITTGLKCLVCYRLDSLDRTKYIPVLCFQGPKTAIIIPVYMKQ